LLFEQWRGRGNTNTYRDAAGGIQMDYPAGWTIQDVNASVKQAQRGYYVTFLSWQQAKPYAGELPSGGTMMQIPVEQWTPLDLDRANPAPGRYPALAAA
jgi:hypothetical protein